MGNLYIVSTPIGNLQDITLRALETLSEVDYIASEDTRKTGILIKHYFKGKEIEMSKKVFSYYEQTEIKRIPQIINLLLNGKNVALVSDAGTPTISDPGFKLVKECLKEGIKVVSIPGPTSLISALVSSGLPTDKFLFLGFLPKKPGHRKTMLKNLKKSLRLINSTVIIFESPYRLLTTLSELKEILGDIEIVIARELTKIHEEVRKDLISNLINHYKTGVKGEIVILLNLK
ncbi:MAG: 16S rRNA (cytidine(1402)-2'-O)-methyltransferase [Actinobacteria bacterium]|nr:16S rRNA (cytidine(1402)-2'-O)-methyltransferase [Actinomycetota bacterium]